MNEVVSDRYKLTDSDCYLVETSDILRPAGIGFPHVNTSLVRKQLLVEVGGFWDGTPYEGGLNFSLRLLDKVDKAIYRPKVTAVNELRMQSNSIGVSSIAIKFKQFYRMLACEHAKLYCNSRWVKAYIRLLHSGVLKTMSKDCYKEGDYSRASDYALRAASIDFSFDWALIGLFLKIRDILKAS